MNPKAKSYYIKTFGCQMNFSDSERIAAFLENQGAEPISNKLILATKQAAKADLVVLNTCGVRKTAEDRAFSWAHKLKIFNPKITVVMTGCLAHREDIKKRMKNRIDFFFPIKDFSKFENYLFENCLPSVAFAKEGKLEIPAQETVIKKQNYLSIKPSYKNPKSILVPIMTGCNNFCSYCVVPYARGREFSRPIQDILHEVQTAGKNGCQEITLLGQNVNSYAFKIKNLKIKKLIENCKLKIENSDTINFPILLDLLASSYPAIHFKFLTSHPKDFSDELMQVVAKNQNISREIHLPVQSGSDKILKLMNRPYTQKHYLSLIAKAKKIIPDVAFTTDVIVGFPGETEEDFQKTVEVFKKVKYNEAYINKYSPRPGTASFSLGDPISWEEKKRREKELRKFLK